MLVGERRDHRLVRVPARDVGERGLGADELGELLLELVVRLERAADEADRRRARAVTVEALLAGLDHLAGARPGPGSCSRRGRGPRRGLPSRPRRPGESSVRNGLYVFAARRPSSSAATSSAQALVHRCAHLASSTRRPRPRTRPRFPGRPPAAARRPRPGRGRPCTLARVRAPRARTRTRSSAIAVGDQRPQVDDAVLEQPAGPVPGLEDLAAVHGRSPSGS